MYNNNYDKGEKLALSLSHRPCKVLHSNTHQRLAPFPFRIYFFGLLSCYEHRCGTRRFIAAAFENFLLKWQPLHRATVYAPHTRSKEKSNIFESKKNYFSGLLMAIWILERGIYLLPAIYIHADAPKSVFRRPFSFIPAFAFVRQISSLSFNKLLI